MKFRRKVERHLHRLLKIALNYQTRHFLEILKFHLAVAIVHIAAVRLQDSFYPPLSTTAQQMWKLMIIKAHIHSYLTL